MLPAKPFYMIRHGQTAANDARIVDGGTIDSPLTEKGEKQAKDLASHLAGLKLKPTRIFHSPLKRTTKTTELLNTVIKLPVTPLGELREQNFGQWEGKPVAELQQIFKDAAKGHKPVDPPGGESQQDLVDRIRDVIEYALEHTPDGPPLLVTHGGAVYAFAILYGLIEHVRKPANCELYLFEPDPENPEIPWKISVFELKDGKLLPSCASFCPERIPATQSPEP